MTELVGFDSSADHGRWKRGETETDFLISCCLHMYVVM